MANFEPKKFNASDINGGQKFNNGDGISAEAINAPIESALLMQGLATTQPRYSENGGSPSVTIKDGQFVFANLKGQKGDKGDKGERGEGVPSGGTAGQVLTKTIGGTAWEDAKGGSSKTILNISGANGYGGYNIFFRIPTAGAKKITVNYTQQYNGMTYTPEFANENVVIFDNGQPLGNVYFTLLTNDYSAETRVTLPLQWQSNDTFMFDVYTASGFQYGGESTTILLTIEY